jgi:hypothetical protein
MSLRRKSLGALFIVVASVSALWGLDKGKPFKPEPASTYEQKQTISGVTIAAKAYDEEELAKTAFGKVNPYEHGVLPVLVVMQNDSKQTIKLDPMQVQFLDGRNKVDATPAAELPYLRSPKRPNMHGTPLPGLGRKPKNPLAAPEFEQRAFAAKMLPPGESAHGFFYFQTGLRKGDRIYLTGLTEAASGKELFFFEIPLRD